MTLFTKPAAAAAAAAADSREVPGALRPWVVTRRLLVADLRRRQDAGVDLDHERNHDIRYVLTTMNRRKTHNCTDQPIDRQTDRRAHTLTVDKLTYRHAYKDTQRQTETDTDSHRQTDRQTRQNDTGIGIISRGRGGVRGGGDLNVK